MVVKIAIVDDESTAASLLEGCLHQYAEETGTAMQWEQFPDAEAFLKSDIHAFEWILICRGAMALRQAGPSGKETNPLCFCL